MLSNAYFLAKFRFDTAENEPAKNLQNKIEKMLIFATAGVEKVAVVTMNDAFVNAEWRKVVMGCANVESSKMEMFADGDGDAVTALGYVFSNSGLERIFLISNRFSNFSKIIF